MGRFKVITKFSVLPTEVICHFVFGKKLVVQPVFSASNAELLVHKLQDRKALTAARPDLKGGMSE